MRRRVCLASVPLCLGLLILSASGQGTHTQRRDEAVQVSCTGVLLGRGDPLGAPGTWSVDLNPKNERRLNTMVWGLDLQHLSERRQSQLAQHVGHPIRVSGTLTLQKEKFVFQGNERQRERCFVSVDDFHPSSAVKDGQVQSQVQVSLTGVLKSPVFAIGGETTGIVVAAQGKTWELDLDDNADWKSFASDHNEQAVFVAGSLLTKPRVTGRRGDELVRQIVRVERLDARADDR